MLESRIARLESRIAELEARLDVNEREASQVREMAQSQPAPRYENQPQAQPQNNPQWQQPAERWQNPTNWARIERGMSEEAVLQILGSPPRIIPSLKPRVDDVYIYETNMNFGGTTLRGRISFRDGEVISIDAPNFR